METDIRENVRECVRGFEKVRGMLLCVCVCISICLCMCACVHERERMQLTASGDALSRFVEIWRCGICASCSAAPATWALRGRCVRTQAAGRDFLR